MVDALEGVVAGSKKRGRRRIKMIDNIKKGNSYGEMKRLAEDRDIWRDIT